MQLTINGESQDIADITTVSDLIAHLELSNKRVAVEVNKELVRRAQHAEHQLQEGDRIEIVTLVGGG